MKNIACVAYFMRIVINVVLFLLEHGFASLQVICDAIHHFCDHVNSHLQDTDVEETVADSELVSSAMDSSSYPILEAQRSMSLYFALCIKVFFNYLPSLFIPQFFSWF